MDWRVAAAAAAAAALKVGPFRNGLADVMLSRICGKRELVEFHAEQCFQLSFQGMANHLRKSHRFDFIFCMGL